MGKNIIIGMLVAIIIIMGGALYYLNANKDTILNKCANQTTETTTVEESSTTTSKAESTNNYINAVYWDTNDGSGEVVLFDDGKCMSLAVASEYNLGTYKIEDGKLILTLEVYDETQVTTYSISSDYNTITSENGTSLKKLN